MQTAEFDSLRINKIDNTEATDKPEETLVIDDDFIESESFACTAEDAGKRIDAVVSERADISRNAAQRLISDGNVTVNEKTVSKNHKVKNGDSVSVITPPPSDCEAAPEDIPVDVIFEDDDIIVVNKPSGMVVHPAPGNYSGTLVNALLHHCASELSNIGGVIRPGIVHRIDKNTSGLLVVAKTDKAHAYLSAQLKDHSISRIYYAIAIGGFKDDSGTINAPIGRHPLNRKKMAVLTSPEHKSREAITHYEVVERYSGYTLLKLTLETGRTHQIRAHLAHVSHPVIGDDVYGGCETQFVKKHPALFDGQALHAAELRLIHPCGVEMQFAAPLPGKMKEAIRILRGTEGDFFGKKSPFTP
jgi:pseudouridine synthase, RluA family